MVTWKFPIGIRKSDFHSTSIKFETDISIVLLYLIPAGCVENIFILRNLTDYLLNVLLKVIQFKHLMKLGYWGD
jgi:hypothetical protein